MCTTEKKKKNTPKARLDGKNQDHLQLLLFLVTCSSSTSCCVGVLGGGCEFPWAKTCLVRLKTGAVIRLPLQTIKVNSKKTLLLFHMHMMSFHTRFDSTRYAHTSHQWPITITGVGNGPSVASPPFIGVSFFHVGNLITWRSGASELVRKDFFSSCS